MSGLQLLWDGDTVSRSVAWLLLCMSTGSWVVIVRKSWVLWRAWRDLQLGLSVFWQAPGLDQASHQLKQVDRDGVLIPLAQATQPAIAGSLASTAKRSQQLTRQLRHALHTVLARLQAGQVWLATVGATAPFVGLLGTVWGIYHALTALSGVRSLGLDQVAGPVGEALIMTAAGLAVALPAVLAYNLMGRIIVRIEAELEGFALDLRDFVDSESHQ